ncbi:MAG TPA: type II toxin-antitoxin system VapC family toxin [Thermodesulfovibrionales bacterium]|nr:type II toxin-antitoxin system VapC family toxin [Thermodesulfovibrionales bacterium]
MIVYLDASALVKRYVAETGSQTVTSLITKANTIGTAAISRAEVSSALGKATRMKVLSHAEAASALQVFTADWENLIRLQITEVLVARAATLAWDHGLRGYDAVHLAAATFWQEMLGDPVVLVTFDRQLWLGASITGLIAWPESLKLEK